MCDLHGTIGELTQGSSDRMRSSLAQEHRCFWRSPVHLLHLLHVAWRLTARGKMRKKKTNYRTSTERETKRLFGSFCLDKMRNQTYLLHFITGPGSLKSIESMEIFHEAFGSLPSQTTRSGPDVSIGLIRTNRVSIQQDQLRALASACLSAFESKLWQLWQSHFGSFGCKVSDDFAIFAIFAINDTTWYKRLQRWSRDLLRC